MLHFLKSKKKKTNKIRRIFVVVLPFYITQCFIKNYFVDVIITSLRHGMKTTNKQLELLKFKFNLGNLNSPYGSCNYIYNT